MSYITTKRLFAFLILLLSMSSFYFILPKFRAAIAYIPVDNGINRINNKMELSAEYLMRLITISQASLLLDDNAHYWENSSLLLFNLAQKQGLMQPEGIATLTQTKNSIQQSLARSPSNAYLWYRLALVNILLAQPSKDNAKLLLMSIMIGPNEVQYLMPRLNLCLLLFAEFTEADEQNLLRQQLKTAWALEPKMVLGYITSNKSYLDAVTVLLSSKDADLLQQILKAVANKKIITD
jgi:hypothetical protein